MDSLTHLALGACIGEAILGKKIGKKAMLIGALANTIPDLDFVAAFWLDADDNLLAHRGFTHSFLFVAISTFFLALLFSRVYKHRIHLNQWLWLFGLEMLSHILIDACNSYGTGWFEPFSHYRVSFNTIFVADPFFSVWVGIASIVLLVKKRASSNRMFWVKFGIGLSGLYVGCCTFNKYHVDKDVKEIITKQHIPHDQYFTSPTPINNWLWYVVAGNSEGFHIGYYSVFDRKKEIQFTYFPKNEKLLQPMYDHEDIIHLKRFSKGFYTVENWNDTLVFNDLRFGQIAGWENPHEKFVFYYYLQHPLDNSLLVQRGRFKKWDSETMQSLIQRIRGN